VLLGFADVEPGSVTPREDQLESLFDDSGEVNRELLRAKIEVLPGAKPGLALLDSDPSTPAMTVGEVLRKAYEAEWAASTTAGIGKYFRSWAREAGISGIAWRPRKST
jgi:hypothetical protein